VKYRFLYTRRAERDIERLDSQVRTRMGKTLLRYADDPLEHAERLTLPGLGTYRFRIGNYRVIFDIEGSDLVVLRVGHRREIYRSR
jgi:mRNA interferase RelE/StbE